MEKPTGRNRRKSQRNQRPLASHTRVNRLAAPHDVHVQQSTHVIGNTETDQQPALDVLTHAILAKQEFHFDTRDELVLPPDSSRKSMHSAECCSETVALYFKFPTFIKKRQLIEHIKKHGFGHNVVSIDMHTNKHTRKPAGSAKVSIAPPVLMKQFVEALHGTCLPGDFQQLLSVQLYEPKRDKLPDHKVFVGPGLPHTITEEDIQKHFVKLKDEITNIQIEKERKRNTCYILITFSSSSAAKQAIYIYNHSNLLDKRIKVELYQPRFYSPPTMVDPKISTAGPKAGPRYKYFHSKVGPCYTIKLVSKSDSEESSAMAMTHRVLGVEGARLGDQPLKSKPQQMSLSQYTERNEKLLKASTTVIAENLDPELTKMDLERITGVKIDKYTPSNLTPDKIAAWITVSNCMDAHTIADYLKEAIVSGEKIHCSMAKSSTLHKLVTRNKNETQVKEQLSLMDCRPCSVTHKDVQCSQLSNIPHHTRGPQDATVISGNQIVSSTLPTLLKLPTDVYIKTISLQQGLWEYLMTRHQDDTLLLQQFIAPFKVNPRIDILLQWETCSITISGVPDAVNIAYNHVSDQIDRHLYVEDRVVMSALVYLNPSLPQELSNEHGVTVLGYSKKSFLIKFDGTPSAVRAARRDISGLLSKAISTKIQFVFSQSLLLVAQKQLKADHCKAYIVSSSESEMSEIVNDLAVTVCSFDEQHHNMAVTLLQTKKLIVKEVSIPPTIMSNDGLIHQLKQVEDDFCVLMKQEVQDINVHTRQVIITGFCPSRVKNAHSSVVDILKLYTEQHVKLECTPEEVIYLCKVDKECESILSSLPVKLNMKGNEITVIGSHDCIAQSKEIIFNGPLRDLQFKSFTFKCKPEFISLIKRHMSEFTYENEFQYYIDEPTNNSHIDNSDKDTSNESKPDGFQLVIYSKNESVFSKVCCETEVLTPNTKLFQLYCEEAVHFIRMGQKSFEDMYHVCMIIDQDACEITLHGLTLDEIQRCWERIDNDVKLSVETTKQIPLERYECMYLEKTQGDELKQSSCDVTFPQQIKCGKYLVSIQGKIQDVQSVESRIADLRKAKIQMIKFNVRCRMSLMVMWRKWWSDFINQEQDKRNVVIQFDDNLKDSSKHGHSMIQVTFEIIGTDVDALRCIKSTLCNEETEERIINVLKVSKSALMDVKKLPLFSTFPLAIADTNQWSGTITLVSPKFLSSNLDIAEKEILKFFELHADVSKEIIFQDPIFRLIFASPTMLIDYINTAKDIAEPENVTVRVLKPSDQARIKLTGNKLAVKKVESLIHTQFVSKIKSTVSYLEYSQTVPSNCILATNEFLQFESDLQNNHCVILSYPRPRCQSKVLHTKVIKSRLFSRCLQLSICYGSIVYEEVDAIVNAANEDLKHVSGIAKSIVVGGGAIIQSESDEHVQLNGKVATGTCVSLGAGKLPCKRIIHAVSPECHGESNEEQIVYDTVYNCLKRADQENLKTIALPAIGTGIFGIPEEVCASASLRAVYDYCQAIVISNISAIKFVLHTPSTLKQFSLAFESTFLSIIEENLTINLEETTSWLWKNDNGSYSPYTPDLSAELTKVYEKSPEGSVPWVINKKTYHIDFSSMTQTNSSTGFQREIRQIIMPPPDPNEAAQWMYMGENYCWSYYTSQDSQIIERMYQNVITVPTVLTIEGNMYTFDFKQKFQINVKTHHKRQIMRVETNSMNEKGTTNKECNDSNEHQFHEDENISDEKLTIKLRGPKDDLQKAKAKLHEKLTSLYTYASNPLFIPFALKVTCCQTAEKYNVTCVIDKENSKCKGKKQMLKLTLSGLTTDVLHVKTCIQEEIDDYDAHDDEYPEEWENLSECETVELQLFQLKRGSNEWKSVEQKFTSTMSHPHHIVEITRIQNTWLWSSYMFQKKRMSKRNNEIINELDLFHGTRKNLPQQIYTSQVGFDMRYSSCGKWGRANYFAEKASYSDSYAHNTPDGTKEMFLVKVLTGESCTDYLTGAAQLRKPPLKSSGGGSRLQEHYDTVTGWTGDCKVYMTYDNDKAYPAYLIKYSTYR